MRFKLFMQISSLLQLQLLKTKLAITTKRSKLICRNASQLMLFLEIVHNKEVLNIMITIKSQRHLKTLRKGATVQLRIKYKQQFQVKENPNKKRITMLRIYNSHKDHLQQ